MAESCLLSDSSSTTKSDFAARMFAAESHYHTGIVALKVILYNLSTAYIISILRQMHEMLTIVTNDPVAWHVFL